MNMSNASVYDKSKTENLTDEDVVRYILDSDKQMYDVILNRYNQRLYRVIYSILNEQEASKETLQHTHVKAYEKLGQFEGRSGFGTWLTRIAINEAIRYLNRRKRYIFHNAMVSENPGEGEYNVSGYDEMNPEFITIQKEIRQILKNAIEALPDKYKRVFMMREVDGLNVEETARSLQISPVNVKVRLSRAKNLLRNMLQNQNPDTVTFRGGIYV